MQTGRILKAGLAVGVVMNIYDYVVNMFVYPKLGTQPAFMNDMASMPIMWLVIGDFVAALVFIWFFDKVRAAFGAGAKGGATYGLYAGILMNFPVWILMHLLVKDWPYGMSWMWTAMGVLWAVIAGAVGGVVYGDEGKAAA
jgi:hypothetical protein